MELYEITKCENRKFFLAFHLTIRTIVDPTLRMTYIKISKKDIGG